MIFFFENGKLGNQLSQYCGLKSYFPKQKIFFFGLNSLQNSFENLEDTFFDLKHKFYFVQILKKILFFLVKIRIIGKITELHKEKNIKIKVIYGIFCNIFVAQEIYFQDRRSVSNIKKLPVLKKRYLLEAQRWLKKKKIFNKKSQLVFVNIRRSDYLFWPNKKFPAVLNLSWYQRSMIHIKQKIKKPIFIIISDDKFYVKDVFKESNNLIISENEDTIDFAIMILCSHGIMSPSSFAWWGSFFIKKSNLYKKPSYFIAPKFWGGHRSKKWFPKNFYFDWIVYK